MVAKTADDDLVADREPAQDLRHVDRLVDDPQLHVDVRHLPLFDAIDERVVVARGLPHGRDRDRHRVRHGLADDASRGERVPLEGAVAVGDLDVDGDGAVGGVDRRRDARHLALQLPTGGGEPHRLPDLELGRLPRRHRRLELEHVEAHHVEDRGAARHVLAGLHGARRHHTGGRGQDARVLRILHRRLEPRLGSCKARLRGRQRLLRRAQVALGDGPRLEQLVRLVGVPLRIGHVGARRFAIGGRRGTVSFLHRVLEARHQLPLRHAVTFTHQHLQHVTFHARPHGDLLDGLEVAADGDAGLDGHRLDLGDVAGAEDHRRGTASAGAPLAHGGRATTGPALGLAAGGSGLSILAAGAEGTQGERA
jgi:hypothetical protein